MEHDVLRRAEERVERRMGFFYHLAVYIIINLGLFIVWYFVSDHGKGFAWFVIPAGGWGVGVLVHFLSVFVFGGLREKMIDKEVHRIRTKKNGQG